MIGTLPTSAEARRFLTDSRPDRRALLVDALLARPEYADYWSLKWADLLRVDRQKLIYSLDPAGVEEVSEWVARIRAFWNPRLDALETALKKDAK